MNILDLEKLAFRTRSMREAGITLVIASVVLGLFMLISPRSAPTPSVVAIDTPRAPDAYATLDIEAKAAVVYDLVTGETLYAKNPTAQLPLASLTKLLTVYAALAALPQQTEITVSHEAITTEAPHAFSAGQTFLLSDIARLTLTASLNDGAAAIASATAARENKTQDEMLAGAAASLDLAQTYAINGSGLDVNTAVSGGYGSASDLARLAGALVELAPSIADSTTHSTATASSTSGKSYTVKNTDPMTASIPRLLLSKTGLTDLAGGNLALVFDVGIRHPVAVVVLGSSVTARFTDGAALVAATLAHFADVSSL